jgi:peptidoglycan hydrolase-like protein with peptidoglycan-binding domain
VRLRRVLLATLILCCSALLASELIGYTTLHQTAIDLRFWRRWSEREETPVPPVQPAPTRLDIQDESGIVKDDQSGERLPQTQGSVDEGRPDVGVDREAQLTEQPTPSSLCSCDYEARTLELRTPYMAGDDVESLQHALAELGFYKGLINGLYTPETAEAVRRLQASQSLTVDGIVGRKTVDAIGALIYQDSEEEGDMSVAELAASPVGPSSKPINPIIVVDLDARRLTVYSEGKPFKSYPVAIGKPSTPSPVGNWKIVNKGMWGGGFGTRWMGLNVPFGRYGIHGTNQPNSIGSAASHGCIRMLNQHVEELYQWVSYGTPVKIIAGGYGDLGYYRPNLSRGATGAAVKEVQCQLRDYGFYTGGLDGIFGYNTEQAVIKFQQANGLEATGRVDQKTYDALGIILAD